MADSERMIETEFKKKRVIVIGDLMVDEHVTGKVRRISPEAPVPVLSFGEIRRTAGGASNVVKNVRTLGAQVCALGVAAEDEAGLWLREFFRRIGAGIDGILSDERPTIIKTRYATKGQQLLRVDHEVSTDISARAKERMLAFLRTRIGRTDAVILSDYCKGVFADSIFVREIIGMCREHHVFVSIDSKSREIECFAGADFVKPNNLELEAAAGVEIVDDESLNRAGACYLKRAGIDRLIVTRGANGISVFERGCRRMDFAADHEAQVYDVTGAGDTVISTSSLALVCGMSLLEAMRLANTAAGIVISRAGTVSIGWEELLKNVRKKEAVSAG